MFDPKYQISGEKAQNLEFSLFSLLKKLSEKVLKLLISLVKLPFNLLLSSQHNKSESVPLQKYSSSEQLKSMENNQKLIEQQRFDKILQDKLQKQGIPDAAQKVKSLRAGHNMLLTKEESEKINQALNETREYISRNPLSNNEKGTQQETEGIREQLMGDSEAPAIEDHKTTQPPGEFPVLPTFGAQRDENSKTSANQNFIPPPPPPSSPTEIAQQQNKASAQSTQQEAQNLSEFIALKLKDKGLSNQAINSILVELKQYEKERPQEQKNNPEQMLIIINEQKRQPNLSEKVKNLFEQLSQAFKQATQSLGNMFKNKPQNLKQDLNNMSVAFTSQRLLDLLGAEDNKGNRVFETNSYKIQANANDSKRNLLVVDKTANSLILSSDKGDVGRLQGNLSKQNLRDFEKLNKQLNLAILETGRQQQQGQTKALPSPTNSLNSRKNNEIER